MAFIEKYIIYILVAAIIALSFFAGYEMLKNAAMKTQIVLLQDKNTSLINQNKALTENVTACQKNLDEVKKLGIKTNVIQKTKESIDQVIDNYKPNVCTPCPEKGEKNDENNSREKNTQPKDDLVHTANIIIDNFNNYQL